MSDDLKPLSKIMLDKASGKFEPDADGFIRFFPSDEWRKERDQWIGHEIERMKAEHADRFAAMAENREAFAPSRLPLPDNTGRAIAPSQLARGPAEQEERQIVNAGLRPRPLFSFDPYFDTQIPVLVKTTVGILREQGEQIDPTAPPEQEVATPYIVDSEFLGEHIEKSMEFVNRERLDFPKHYQKVVHYCVTEGTAGCPACYWEISWQVKPQRTIAVRNANVPAIDLSDEDEEYGSVGGVSWAIIPGYDVLRSDIDKSMDEQSIVSKRATMAPDTVRQLHADGRLFLIKKDEEAESLAKNTTLLTVDESKVRTDSSTRNFDRDQHQAGKGSDCDVWDVSFYAYLKVVDPERPEEPPSTQQFLLQCLYHYGARRSMNMYRWPYKHGHRNLIPFSRAIDGASIVEVLKGIQHLQTVLEQAEAKDSYDCANPTPWFEPNSPNAARIQEFAAGNGGKIPRGATMLPFGKPGQDWGFEAASITRNSRLPYIQHNAARARDASKQGYGTGAPVVSHTAASTVDLMLERSDQGDLLFLRILDRGLSEVMRQTIRVYRQFDPFGLRLPVKDPVTDAIVTVPFLLPVRDVLDNFRISFMAADVAIQAEEDARTLTQDMIDFREYATFMTQVMTGIRDPKVTPEDLAWFRRIGEAGDALYGRVISAKRADKRKFDLLEPMDAMIAARLRQLEGGALAGNQNAGPVGAGPGAAPTGNGGAPIGVAEQPGVVEGSEPAPPQGSPPVAPI